MATFGHRAKEVITCSPTVAKSEIDRNYEASDKREYFVPCPLCDHLQSMMGKFHSQVRWDKSLPTKQEQAKSARYYCEQCNAPWDDAMRMAAVERGKWKAQAAFTGVAGFWISELYSPWKLMEAIVLDFLSKKDDPGLLRTFVNTSLAENWQALGDPVWEGATENESTCKALIEDLVARGVRNDRSRLFVIDGSKALVAAIRKTFGRRALIQRCQVHKQRNVEDHLPESMKKQVGRAMAAAYRCGHLERAKRMLNGLAKQLERKYPSAAASLREGLDETLTVLRFTLPAGLERTLSTTNAIEFVNSRIRKKTHNVTQWNGGTMVLRWVAVALVETAKTFRKLRGYVWMPKLVAALRDHDAALNSKPVDGSQKAA